VSGWTFSLEAPILTVRNSVNVIDENQTIGSFIIAADEGNNPQYPINILSRSASDATRGRAIFGGVLSTYEAGATLIITCDLNNVYFYKDNFRGGQGSTLTLLNTVTYNVNSGAGMKLIANIGSNDAGNLGTGSVNRRRVFNAANTSEITEATPAIFENMRFYPTGGSVQSDANTVIRCENTGLKRSTGLGILFAAPRSYSLGVNNNNPYSIAWNGATWAVGTSPAANPTTVYLVSSADGQNWINSTSTPFGTNFSTTPITSIDVAWAGTRWIASAGNRLDSTNPTSGGSSNDASLAISSDGRNWFPVTNSKNSILTIVNRVAYDGLVAMAVGASTISSAQVNALSFDNGLTWSTVTNSPAFAHPLTAVASNGQYWVAGNNSGRLFSSPNGCEWTAASGDNFGNGPVGDIAWNGTTWVACAAGGNAAIRSIIRTTDISGQTGWTSTLNSFTTNTLFRGLAWNGNAWFASNNAGTSTLYTSADDGATWQQRFVNANGVSAGSRIASIYNVLPILPKNSDVMSGLSYVSSTNSPRTFGVSSVSAPIVSYLNASFVTTAVGSASTTLPVSNPRDYRPDHIVYVGSINSTTTPAGTYVVQGTNSQNQLVIRRDPNNSSFAAASTTIAAQSQVVQYAGQIPMYISPIVLFGSGQEGDLVLSGAGPTSFSKDRYLRNLAWATGSTNTIFMRNCKLFVNGVLDLTNCPVGGIQTLSVYSTAANSGGFSNAYPNNAGITAPFGGIYSTLGFTGSRGTSGGAPLNTGNPGDPITITANMVGGNGGRGGSVAGAPSNSGGAITDTRKGLVLPPVYDRTLITYLNTTGTESVTTINGGAGGTGGACGGENNGAANGGGAGGFGGMPIVIFARTIIRPQTPTECIRSIGQAGGPGGPQGALTSTFPGGAGGGGGGGGYVYIFYDNLTGPPNTLRISVSGGNGGIGGTTNNAAKLGGNGGGGGDAGSVMLISNATGRVDYYDKDIAAGTSGVVTNTAAVATASNATTSSGTAGAAGGVLTVSL
jgi:hypothetical protein